MDRTGGETTIVVEVIRTGGIAGLRREWRASAPPDANRRWVVLIERCPWNAAEATDPTAADRFQWCIRARAGGERHEAELADRALTGPWRDLVDEVRRAASPSPAQSGGAGV